MNSISLLRRALVGTTALAGTLVFAQSAHAQTAYAIRGGNNLVSFNLATPSTVTTIGTFSGAVGTLDGLDFRPADGLLYGYTDNGNRIVTVNLTTAVTTLVSTAATGTTTANLGIDFNPVADRLRVVDTLRENLRINVDNGVTIADGTLTYAAGDINQTALPNIVDAAYTNSDTNAATGTTLYYIDSIANTLVTTSNPNGGVLNTVGSLGIDVTENTGFDIFTNTSGANFAYGTFQLTDVGGPYGLYSINLSTGAATSLGSFGVPSTASVYGLAINQNTVAAPEPGTFALLAVSLVPLAGLAARRRRAC